MAGYDRWGSDRYRRGGDRDQDHERYGPEPDRFTRADRESFARGDGFGHGTRDYPGGREYHSYARDRDSMGRGDEPGRDWDSDYRAGYGRRGPRRDYAQGRGGFGDRDEWRDADQDWRRHRGRDRSVGEMAFGRNQGGRDDPGGFGHGNDPDRGGWFERMSDEVASWFGGAHDHDRLRRLDLREGEDAGLHRGRGPKSYQRSDERILEDINDRLTDDPLLDASDIEVSVSGREVTLSGTVASRADKRRAEDISDCVSGVTHVQNNLRVRAQPGGANWSDDRVSNTTELTGIGSVGGTGRGPRS